MQPVDAHKVALLLGHYEMFFAASAGASAAILGLLVVAVSVVNADDEDAKTRERRTVLAGSAFLALVDAFFVSIVALTGGAAVFGTSNLVMAMVGLLATIRLIGRAKRAGNFSRGFPTRRLNLAFAAISVGGYSIQLGLAIALLTNSQSSALQRALVLIIVGLFGSALGRAWEVTGIPRRRLPDPTIGDGGERDLTAPIGSRGSSEGPPSPAVEIMSAINSIEASRLSGDWVGTRRPCVGWVSRMQSGELGSRRPTAEAGSRQWCASRPLIVVRGRSRWPSGAFGTEHSARYDRVSIEWPDQVRVSRNYFELVFVSAAGSLRSILELWIGVSRCLGLPCCSLRGSRSDFQTHRSPARCWSFLSAF